MSHHSFHVSLHARPPEAAPGPVVELRQLKLRTLDVPRTALAFPFELSFETAETALAQLPRMYCEPDGSFVWVSSTAEPSWQLDGNLYDRQERLLFVDLKGNCPADVLDQLLTALGWPATPVMFQLVREAVFLDEDEFRRYATAAE